VEILDLWILVDFSDFSLGSKQQVIRHFCLQWEAVNRSLRLS